MLIEQTIKFEFRVLYLLVVYVLLQLVIFMTIQKSLRKIFEWIIIYGKNSTVGNVPCFSIPGPNHLQTGMPKSWGDGGHRRSQGGQAPPPNQNTTNDKKL